MQSLRPAANVESTGLGEGKQQQKAYGDTCATWESECWSDGHTSDKFQ